MDDIEMRLLSRRRVYHELYEDPNPPQQPQEAGNPRQKAGSSRQKTGSREAEKRPKKGGGRVKNRPTATAEVPTSDSRSPSKRPPATEMDDTVVVNGLPAAVEH